MLIKLTIDGLITPKGWIYNLNNISCDKLVSGNF